MHPTQDPEFSIADNRLVSATSGEPVPHDEPVFIFRASDRHLPSVLAFYRMLCEETTREREIEEREAEIESWQSRNREMVREPGMRHLYLVSSTSVAAPGR